ncbi:hydrogenase accessory protein [Tabrizicola sp. J26]|uniref:hydrogenase accessory protein n=1 Tax=Alitabrizicola rongguiensis TaxID=2909234 RepID=UPI001F298CA5|nr:hydrogenase accessory protein [Tabrizicola rongguiensis]MCF1709327.1 hydrogenase accessory protein [Tabrizicola rongguiensis]
MHDHSADFAMPDAAASRGPHPLVMRLETEMGWPRLASLSDVAEFTGRPGAHCLFVPGDANRNLETADAAVILPELRIAFQNGFDCALVDDVIEAQVREAARALRTPGFLFFREGRYLGAIEKVRDWDDYLARTTHILGQ